MKAFILPLLFIVLFIVFSNFNCRNATDIDIKVLSTWSGSYDATYNSDGIVRGWTLYDNGTMTGDWLTQNGSYTLGFSGKYTMHADTNIAFQASGSVVIQEVQSQFRINGSGILGELLGSGDFYLDFDNEAFHDDTGTWSVQKES